MGRRATARAVMWCGLGAAFAAAALYVLSLVGWVELMDYGPPLRRARLTDGALIVTWGANPGFILKPEGVRLRWRGRAWRSVSPVWWPRLEPHHPVLGSSASLPLWIPVLLAAAPTAYLVRQGRREAGACGACGYDLRGISGPVCPECGNGVRP